MTSIIMEQLIQRKILVMIGIPSLFLEVGNQVEDMNVSIGLDYIPLGLSLTVELLLKALLKKRAAQQLQEATKVQLM